MAASFALTANAQIYKYTDKDGNSVYTDKLSQLPPARRDHYHRIKRVQDQQERLLENRLGKEEYERRKLEEQRKRLLAEHNESKERLGRQREACCQKGPQKRNFHDSSLYSQTTSTDSPCHPQWF